MFFKFLYSALFSLLIFLFPQAVFAGEPPQLSSPSDGSTVTSSKLEWQIPSYTLYAGNNFRVQVDDDPAFSSLNKDYYTDNTYYTPTLTEGVWNWRVKAKNADGVWSDWSSIWSFTLSFNTSTPSPSPTENPVPTPSSTPTPTSSSTSAFIISGIPSQINSDQSFNVTVNLTLPNNPGTQFYLKGAFKKADGSNYFGYTLVSGSWVKNGSSYSSQYPITTDSAGSWSGNLEVKGDSEDSGFEGTGDYKFRVGRYTSSGSGPTWSNELSIKIVGIINSDSDSQSSQGNAQSIKKVTSSPTPSASKNSSLSGSIFKTVSDATVAAASIEPTASSVTENKPDRQINSIPWIGGFLVLSGISSLGFIYLKKRKIHGSIHNQI
ncbi:hypothetical protein A3B45_03420 [Candidatus Daviesbacteria bacterium RIFCSPLOWO2_01_FULL_39_12]|uniref:Fibronectin type-III domain-containing protein n=1 Tax=Candidatus Daviesbacteria bacterium RIFCSPLOWO2_01_FULL_39_12 TaxID=1797785 RepID=A0A1F5KSA8_9BACT|nr:MAG: hypothetical protein A3D79_03445 [Candidatus Daviesbacteria bacterium RIFCSPHIGHO2_02_FULL_39_8]OGE43710.1 MAG: hypothetical protein A3B45_03420 [Candidatus Daviesbacteria bacterium RIFCSPLOWO2_01_FULL_39_12]